MKAFLRGDGPWDGHMIDIDVWEEGPLTINGITFDRHDIRTGLARWTEFWAMGWEDPDSGRTRE